MAAKVNIKEMTHRGKVLILNLLPGRFLFKFIQLCVRSFGGAFSVSEIKLFMDSGLFGLTLQSRHSNWVKYYFNF